MAKEIDRRSFLKTAGGIALGSMILPMGASLLSAKAGDELKLIILSTNDVHSRIEPFPANDRKFAGRAGFARRETLIKQVRAENEYVLLFDAGDIFQGTPYFNMFGGEIEFKLMSDMKYDAATMGNHDFDNGLQGFKKQLPHAKFPFICSNYDFSNTLLNGETLPYKIFEVGPMRIGVLAVGVELDGLVSKKNYQQTVYMDPVEIANKYAKILKDKNCDMVVCISHLGFDYKTNKVSDKILAAKTRNIDYIIGGHTHTFMDAPFEVKNLDGKIVPITQTGWAGINLGQMEVVFTNKSTNDIAFSYTSKKVKSQG